MEIEKILVQFGAKGIMKEYSGSEVDTIAFYLDVNDKRVPFKLPMNLERARKVIEVSVDNGTLPKRFRDEPYRSEKAQIVGWRVIKDWIHSQLSLLEIEFADPIEILLPYAYDLKEKKTFYEKIQDKQILLPEMGDA